MVERNQMRFAKVIFTFGNHCVSITPDAHLPIIAKFANNFLKCCYSFSIVFEKKQRFHLFRIYSRAVCTGTADSGVFLFVSPK